MMHKAQIQVRTAQSDFQDDRYLALTLANRMQRGGTHGINRQGG